ncbi:hypothetical protein BGZ54_003366, partial [Gamsiella multidivaricata]
YGLFQVKAAVDDTEFDVAIADLAGEIQMAKQNREHMCHGYDRMDAMFGRKPNVDLAHEVLESIEEKNLQLEEEKPQSTQKVASGTNKHQLMNSIVD